jgi:hypothetical protein
MLTLDDDETDLVLMAGLIAAEALVARGTHASMFCLPRLRALIERIEQHKQDVAEEKADG